MPLYDRALKMDRATLAPDDLQIAALLVWRAVTLNHLERLDEAAQGYDEALAIYERAGARSFDQATTFYNRGELEVKRGQYDRALRDYTRAVALTEDTRGPNTDQLFWPLLGQARCLVFTGHAAEAIAPAERAHKLPIVVKDASSAAYAQYYMGRARVETRRDVAGGLAMVRAARATWAAAHEEASMVREADAWLTAHR